MPTLKGMSTMVLTADDVDAAARWYADATGVDPYFRRPDTGPAAYAEFRLGPDDDEFGIMDRRFAPGAAGLGTSVTYWVVDDVDAAVADLLARGAIAHEPVTVRGEGFVTASVVDPFGNLLGLMHNAHWAARHRDHKVSNPTESTAPAGPFRGSKRRSFGRIEHSHPGAAPGSASG
ncbi:MAG: VOC family protein [Micropruina sp.]|nr:MAG: VOC family protein [Micropruina sp.]